MAKACYHHGLTIEFDAQVPRLTIDGQNVPVVGKFDGSAGALIEQAKEFVNASRDFAARDSIRDDHVQRFRSGIDGWNQWRLQNPAIRPLLYGAELNGIDPGERVNLANANLIGAHLRGAILTGANLHEANLGGADLTGAHLEFANFCRTDLYETILRQARLDGANLQGTQLAKTDFSGAYLTGCRIYGLSAWDIKVDQKTVQKDLVIVYEKPARTEEQGIQLGRVIVDDLRLAQFLYLILHNENIRYVFETASRKTVLILGRFGDHKPVLERIRDWLREKDLIPLLFDFDNPVKDLDETVRVLAGLSRFVIADLTDPQSIPMELEALVKTNRIPFLPVIAEGGRAFSLSREFHWFWWFLQLRSYTSVEDLVVVLEERLGGEIPAVEERLRSERAAAAAKG
jgi:Pentapeptide repeats (8 copies)